MMMYDELLASSSKTCAQGISAMACAEGIPGADAEADAADVSTSVVSDFSFSSCFSSSFSSGGAVK